MTRQRHEEIDIPILVEADSLLPVYASADAAGADVRANIQQELIMVPGSSAIIPTGIRVAIPKGYEIQVRPRSGLAAKHQVTIVNTPGTIDADYRGEIKVILINHGKEPFTVEPHMRIAQLVVAPIIQANFVVEEILTATVRGEGGFGHTGLS